MTNFACVNCRAEFESDGSTACPHCGSNVMVSTDIVRPQEAHPNGHTPDVNGYIAEIPGWATHDGRWFERLNDALAHAAPSSTPPER